MSDKLNVGSIRYFTRSTIDQKYYTPGVVVGYSKKGTNYKIIFYDGHYAELPIAEVGVKVSRGLEPVLRDLLTELCNAYVQKEELETKYKLADLHYRTLCGNALFNADKWEKKWNW